MSARLASLRADTAFFAASALVLLTCLGLGGAVLLQAFGDEPAVHDTVFVLDGVKLLMGIALVPLGLGFGWMRAREMAERRERRVAVPAWASFAAFAGALALAAPPLLAFMPAPQSDQGGGEPALYAPLVIDIAPLLLAGASLAILAATAGGLLLRPARATPHG
ncbi:MAG: hypothetical protein MI723_17675 [Caulobacterales bacterium]|nr:hypothetical protein [Caulobacterales bacterium]